MSDRKWASHVDANSKRLKNLGTPTVGSDGARKTEVDNAQAFAVSRANHTGTQVAATISDFDTAVRLNRLDQLAAPTGPVGLNSQRLTAVADPTTGTDGANRNYVDTALAGVASGMQFKGQVKVVVSTNVNLANPGTSTLDGIAMSNGDIFLAAGQTTGSQNGPYVFNGAAVGATRATNWDSAGEAQLGSFWVVLQGTRADNFAIMTNDTFTLGTTTATFQFVGVAPAATAPFEADLGDAAATVFNCDHNFGTKAVLVSVFRNASPFDEVDVYVARPTVNRVTIEPDETWTAAQFHVVITKA